LFLYLKVDLSICLVYVIKFVVLRRFISSFTSGHGTSYALEWN